MVDVFMDKRLDDYFTSFEWDDIARSDHVRDSVIQDFLSEKIAVLHGLDTQALDFSFLETVRFPQSWKMKKFQFKDLLDQVRDGKTRAGVYEFVLNDVFRGDADRFAYFADQLMLVEQIANRIIDRLTGGLTVSKTIMITRFSETRMENLHYDMDVDSDDHEALRLYINLDAYPRIWSTSYPMTTLFREGGRRLLDRIDPDERSETILKRAVTRAYGGWNQRATERLAPRHQVFFDPGDVWLVDGRSVSHQVLSGHRVLSVYIKIPHAENPGLGPTFAEKLRAAFADGIKRPIGEETALVNYYPPKEITSAPNLQETWSETFGRTRTGQVRRFDENGLVVAPEEPLRATG